MKPAGAAMTAGKRARSGHFSKRSGTLFLYELRKIAETRFLPVFLLLFLLAGCYIAGNNPIFFQKGALDSLNDIAAEYLSLIHIFFTVQRFYPPSLSTSALSDRREAASF